ncbi:MAG: hypothetical protein ACRC1H_15690, partial [Caldilineaceae bacterium]
MVLRDARSRRRRLARLAGGALLVPLLLMVAMLLLAPAQRAWAQETSGQLVVDKSIVGGLAAVDSGAEYRYAINYTCASANFDCLDARLQDTLPDGLEYLGTD